MTALTVASYCQNYLILKHPFLVPWQILFSLFQYAMIAKKYTTSDKRD